MKTICALLFLLIPFAVAQNARSRSRRVKAVSHSRLSSNLTGYDHYVSKAPSEECGKLMIKSDHCIQDALFAGKKDQIPSTLKQVDAYCDKLKETVACVQSYRQCLEVFPRTLFQVLVRDVKKQMKLICSSTTKKGEALQHLKCFQNGNEDFLYNIINGFTNVLYNISGPGEDPAAMIPKSCCAYHILTRKAVQLVDKDCNPRTGLKTGSFVADLVKSVVEALTDMACGSHGSVEVCRKVLPQETDLFFQLFDQGISFPAEERYKFSPILPVIVILNQLDSKVNLRP